MTINDGGSVFNKYGLIENLKTILGGISVSGLQNCQRLILVAQGLDALAEGMRKEEDHADHDRPGADA